MSSRQRTRHETLRVTRKALFAFSVALCALLAALVINTAAFDSRQVESARLAPTQVGIEQAAERLSKAIQWQTVSSREEVNASAEEFRKLREHLAASFPVLHSKLTLEAVNGSALLYTWPGRDPNLLPILLAAHIDVVPADDVNWEHPPFAGKIAEGFIWGRGAIDDKSGVMAILEAVKILLQSGFEPNRTIFIALGHDEEVGGANGAGAIAQLLRSRGVVLESVLDEGGAVTRGILPLEASVATVGIAEKGYLTLELSVETKGGHSMNPPPQTAIGTLARAIARLEANPFPARIDGATRELFKHIGPEISLLRRVVLANLWLFGPLVERQLQATPSTDAAIRTTIAATIFEAGARENVLPAKARATVNFRILPGDSVDHVVSRVREVIDDSEVGIRVLGKAFEPSLMSSTESPAYSHLARTIRALFPEAVVAPYLVPGATDARHYAPLARNVYRFLPLPMTAEDLARFHGVNERIALYDYRRMIQFYAQLIATSN
jgi:carboxypeptidase PM20D1